MEKKYSNCRTFFLRNIVFHFSTQFEKNLPSSNENIQQIFGQFHDILNIKYYILENGNSISVQKILKIRGSENTPPLNNAPSNFPVRFRLSI